MHSYSSRLNEVWKIYSIKSKDRTPFFFIWLYLSKTKGREFIRISCHNDSQELNMEDNLVSLFDS